MSSSTVPYARVAFLSSILFLGLLVRSVLGPFLLTIEREMGLSHGAAGALFLFLATGYGATMLLQGFVARAIGHRRSIVASLALLGIATLLASGARAVGPLRLALLFVGASAALYMPSGMATIYRITPRERWGAAVAIHEIGPGLAFVAAPLYAEAALRISSWRAGMAALGLIALAGAPVFAFFGPPGDQRGEAPRLQNVGVFFRDPAFWVVAVAFWLSAALGVGAYSILPVFLASERGLDRATVNLLLGASRLTGLPAIFLAGALADRLSPRLLIGLLVGGAGGLAIAVGLGHGAVLVAAVFLLPLLTSCFFPVGFAALTRVGRPGLENVAVSLVVPMGYFLGGGLVPSAMGRLGEDGRFWLGFVALGALAVAASVIAAAVRLARARARGGRPLRRRRGSEGREDLERLVGVLFLGQVKGRPRPGRRGDRRVVEQGRHAGRRQASREHLPEQELLGRPRNRRPRQVAGKAPQLHQRLERARREVQAVEVRRDLRQPELLLPAQQLGPAGSRPRP